VDNAKDLCPNARQLSHGLSFQEHNELVKMLRYTQESLIHIPIDDLLTGPFSGLTTAQHDGV